MENRNERHVMQTLQSNLNIIAGRPALHETQHHTVAILQVLEHLPVLLSESLCGGTQNR